MPFKDKNKLKEYSQAYNHQYYFQHKQKRMADSIKSTKQIRSRNKKFLTEYKSTLSCLVCGEKESCCLDFHHKDDNKSINVANMVGNGYSIDRIIKEISKCYVVCANCHRKIHNGIIKI